MLREKGDAVKHGYTNADVVSRNGGVSSSALISGGFDSAVTSAAITSGGTGQPAVATTVAATAADISVVPAGGENMTASVTIDGTGAVTAIALSGGIDYKAGQTVTIDATSIAGLTSNVVFTLPASQPLSSTIEVTAAQITTTSVAGTGMTATVVTDANGSPTISLTGGTGYVVGDRITLGTGGALTTPIVMEITGTEGDGIFNIKGAEFDIDRPVNTVATDSMSILGLSSGAAERFSITSGGIQPAGTTVTGQTYLVNGVASTTVSATVTVDTDGVVTVSNLTGDLKVGDVITISGGGLVSNVC